MTIYNKCLHGYYIYAYIRKSNGTPYYIGKGKGNRCLQPHIVKVPKDRSKIIIMEQNLTDLGACALERRLIRWYGRKDNGTGILRNQTDGGDGTSGRKLSDAEREERRNRRHTNQSRQKIRESNTGKLHTTETKDKLSVIAKNRTTDHFKGGFKGRNHTQETKDRLHRLTSSKQWYNNGTIETMACISPGPDWVCGRLQGILMWWNNGQLIKRSISQPGPEWVVGRLRGTRGTTGMRCYNNGIDNKLFLTDPVQGWKLGKIPVSRDN